MDGTTFGQVAPMWKKSHAVEPARKAAFLKSKRRLQNSQTCSAPLLDVQISEKVPPPVSGANVTFLKSKMLKTFKNTRGVGPAFAKVQMSASLRFTRLH